MARYSIALLFLIEIMCACCQAIGQVSDTAVITVSTYNVLNLGVRDYSFRDIDCSHIVGGLQADIVVLQEVVDSFDLKFMAEYVSMVNAPIPFLSETYNALLFDSTVISYMDETVVPIGQRFASQWRVIIRNTGDTLVVVGCQLSEGDDSLSRMNRSIEAQALRYHIHAIGLQNYIVAGTLNVQSSDDPAYRWLVDESPFGDSILKGQTYDPVKSPGIWHDNIDFAQLHTTSTRLGVAQDSGAGGGLIDRYDFILLSKNLMDLSYVANSYRVQFNYGISFRDSILAQNPLHTHLAWAQNASDHLPVVLDLVMRRNVSSVDSPASLPTKMDLSQRYSTDIDPFTVDNSENDRPFGIPPLPVTQSTSQP